MKTTIELPDDLMRQVKMRAVEENRRIKEVMADLLRRGLDADAPGRPRRRVRFPLIEGTRPAEPADEMTPDRVAVILLAEDAATEAGPDVDPL